MKMLCQVMLFIAVCGAINGFTEADLPKGDGGIAQSKKELGSIKKKIQEEKQRVRDMGKKESSVLSQLNALDRNLAKKEKEWKSLDQRLKVVAGKVKKASQVLEFLNQTMAAQEKFLAYRLIALYKSSDAADLPQVLFSSQSYEDFMSNQRYLTSILQQDRQLMEDYRKRQQAAGDNREHLRAGEKELRELKHQTEQKRAEIQKDRKEKTRLLDSVRDGKRLHLAAIKELENASEQLQGLINRLERELRAKARQEIFTPSGKGFGALRGKLALPVEGPLLSTFGRNENPRFNTFTVQKGIEIEAPLGAEIRAVYDGRILYADWFKGYGKILIIDHGEGYYTLSGHASSLLKKVGEEVRTGEVIGLVGDTGSLKGPCLYFEIRQRGKPLDPLEWLAHQKR